MYLVAGGVPYKPTSRYLWLNHWPRGFLISSLEKKPLFEEHSSHYYYFKKWFGSNAFLTVPLLIHICFQAMRIIRMCSILEIRYDHIRSLWITANRSPRSTINKLTTPPPLIMSHKHLTRVHQLMRRRRIGLHIIIIIIVQSLLERIVACTRVE